MAATTRPAGPADAHLVGRLLHDFNVEFDEETTPSAADFAGRFEHLLARDDVLVVLAGEVGFAYLTLRPSPYYDGPVAMLEELYVAPGRRGAGIGSAIMARVLDELAQRGAGEMQINVDEVDTDARRFYERHGFTNIEHGSRMLLYIQEF